LIIFDLFLFKKLIFKRLGIANISYLFQNTDGCALKKMLNELNEVIEHLVYKVDIEIIIINYK
jgi:hypothetical protein